MERRRANVMRTSEEKADIGRESRRWERKQQKDEQYFMTVMNAPESSEKNRSVAQVNGSR